MWIQLLFASTCIWKARSSSFNLRFIIIVHRISQQNTQRICTYIKLHFANNLWISSKTFFADSLCPIIRNGDSLHTYSCVKNSLKEFTKGYTCSQDLQTSSCKSEQLSAAAKESSTHQGVDALLMISWRQQNVTFSVPQLWEWPGIISTQDADPWQLSRKSKWVNDECDFHPLRVCSCEQCQDKDELECEGKEYKSQRVLYCQLHSLAYKM